MSQFQLKTETVTHPKLKFSFTCVYHSSRVEKEHFQQCSWYEHLNGHRLKPLKLGLRLSQK